MFGYTMNTKFMNLTVFTITVLFPLLLAEMLQNHSFSNIWNLISFLAKFRQLKKGAWGRGGDRIKEKRSKKKNKG
jgi:hypothetical protein